MSGGVSECGGVREGEEGGRGGGEGGGGWGGVGVISRCSPEV